MYLIEDYSGIVEAINYQVSGGIYEVDKRILEELDNWEDEGNEYLRKVKSVILENAECMDANIKYYFVFA